MTFVATPCPILKSRMGRDAIVRVTSCAICGSDLHLFDGFVPGMKSGDIMGHEFMGEVVAVGRDNKKLKKGDRVVVPFTIICGECEQCRRGNFSVCERTNRNKHLGDVAFGHSTAGLFGYTHLTGGYPGGQAEYVRVPYADVGPVKIPDGLSDEQVLFLGDIFPTGWQAAVACDIEPTDTVAVWGAGPVGQFCVRSAILLGAKQVVVIDNVPERLTMAQAGGADPHQFRRGKRLGHAERAHPRERSREMYRRGRPRGPRHALDRLHLRPDQAGPHARKRPRPRHPRDVLCLSPGRHRFNSGRLWRTWRQDPAGRHDEQGTHDQDWPDSRQSLDR